MRLHLGATWVRVDLCTNLLGYELTCVRVDFGAVCRKSDS